MADNQDQVFAPSDSDIYNTYLHSQIQNFRAGAKEIRSDQSGKKFLEDRFRKVLTAQELREQQLAQKAGATDVEDLKKRLNDALNSLDPTSIEGVFITEMSRAGEKFKNLTQQYRKEVKASSVKKSEVEIERLKQAFSEKHKKDFEELSAGFETLTDQYREVLESMVGNSILTSDKAASIDRFLSPFANVKNKYFDSSITNASNLNNAIANFAEKAQGVSSNLFSGELPEVVAAMALGNNEAILNSQITSSGAAPVGTARITGTSSDGSRTKTFSSKADMIWNGLISFSVKTTGKKRGSIKVHSVDRLLNFKNILDDSKMPENNKKQLLYLFVNTIYFKTVGDIERKSGEFDVVPVRNLGKDIINAITDFLSGLGDYWMGSSIDEKGEIKQFLDIVSPEQSLNMQIDYLLFFTTSENGLIGEIIPMSKIYSKILEYLEAGKTAFSTGINSYASGVGISKDEAIEYYKLKLSKFGDAGDLNPRSDSAVSAMSNEFTQRIINASSGGTAFDIRLKRNIIAE